MHIRHLIQRSGIVLGIWALLGAPAYADTVGEAYPFIVNATFDAQAATSVNTTLRLVGQSASWYVDDRYWNTMPTSTQEQFMTALRELSVQMDTVIVPRARAFWGSENTPGVDGDPHIVVVMEQLKQGAGGYFESIHNYPVSQPGSNGREMVYVNVESVLGGGIKNMVAHELQHLISFNQRELIRHVSEDVWLNEARSEYDITVAGYSTPYQGSALERRVQAFMRTPSNSLVGWPNTSDDYAIASVFIHYLADRFGGDILSASQHSTLAGVASIDAWLRAHTDTRFSQVFTEWMAASYLNDQRIGEPYGYARADLSTLHVRPQQIMQLTPQEQYLMAVSVQEWQPLWVGFGLPATTPGQSLMVRVAGTTQTALSGALMVHYQSGLWRVMPLVVTGGQATVSVPTYDTDQTRLDSAVVVFTQGALISVGDRTVGEVPISISAMVGTGELVDVQIATPEPAPLPSPVIIDGDLVSHQSEPEVYVVWGQYRRFLPPGVLALYGFESRPVTGVSSDTFEHYRTTNYVRAQGDSKVYAVWPDGTKHWLNITAAQWEVSGRDWSAIFTINDRELAWYRAGTTITR